MKEMNIPVGVSDFEEIRKNGYYYIDKSGLIGELISRTGTKVTLITRPRRFGKTLGMSMLESFFDIRKDSRKLFEGLEITKNQALCDEWMNQYPTIFVSFRQVDGLNFTGAYDMLTMVIADLYNKHLYLLDSKSATEFQKTAFAHGCTRKSCNFVTNVSRTVDGDWSWRGFGYRNHVQKLAFFKPFFLFNELIFKQRNHSVSAAKGERTDF